VARPLVAAAKLMNGSVRISDQRVVAGVLHHDDENMVEIGVLMTVGADPDRRTVLRLA